MCPVAKDLVYTNIRSLHETIHTPCPPDHSCQHIPQLATSAAKVDDSLSRPIFPRYGRLSMPVSFPADAPQVEARRRICTFSDPPRNPDQTKTPACRARRMLRIIDASEVRYSWHLALCQSYNSCSSRTNHANEACHADLCIMDCDTLSHTRTHIRRHPTGHNTTCRVDRCASA